MKTDRKFLVKGSDNVYDNKKRQTLINARIMIIMGLGFLGCTSSWIYAVCC